MKNAHVRLQNGYGWPTMLSERIVRRFGDLKPINRPIILDNLRWMINLILYTTSIELISGLAIRLGTDLRSRGQVFRALKIIRIPHTVSAYTSTDFLSSILRVHEMSIGIESVPHRYSHTVSCDGQ